MEAHNSTLAVSQLTATRATAVRTTSDGVKAARISTATPILSTACTSVCLAGSLFFFSCDLFATCSSSVALQVRLHRQLPAHHPAHTNSTLAVPDSHWKPREVQQNQNKKRFDTCRKRKKQGVFNRAVELQQALQKRERGLSRRTVRGAGTAGQMPPVERRGTGGEEDAPKRRGRPGEWAPAYGDRWVGVAEQRGVAQRRERGRLARASPAAQRRQCLRGTEGGRGEVCA